MRCHLQISSYRIDLMSVNGPISPKQCYYEMDYSFYSFYWLSSLEIWLDPNSTYYRSLSKNSNVKRRISHCDFQNLQYKTHPEFWPSHRRIFKTSLYYKTRLILETRRQLNSLPCSNSHFAECHVTEQQQAHRVSWTGAAVVSRLGYHVCEVDALAKHIASLEIGSMSQ